FEMAWLVRHGRIDLDMAFEEWLQQIEADRIIRFLPVTPWISARAVALPEHHKDPQDRIIIATALHNNARLISFLTSLVEQPQGRWRMSSSGDVSLFPDQISVQFSESAKFLCRPQA
ncbi:MAG: type II toxin-antitoxin system VapC family toxin, partial [Candidatus Contendobacter sp.]|nr:type II toxin-antitoxin system VapC family toxin [Candidatus Contendobacter sp.]